MPVAVNVGDATNVLALDLLLRNTETIGVRKALLVLREVERMARESAEGQAIELGWIAGSASTSATGTTCGWRTRRRAGTR